MYIMFEINGHHKGAILGAISTTSVVYSLPAMPPVLWDTTRVFAAACDLALTMLKTKYD